MRTAYVYGMCALLAGCSSLPRKLPAGSDRTLLYPPAIYKHEVEVRSSQGNYSFRGVVKISSTQILVVGLSPFQTTVFKIDDNRATGKVDIQIYQETLENHRVQLVEFYSWLREFLTLPRGTPGPKVTYYERNAAGDPVKIGLQMGKDLTRIHIRHYDENGVADDIQLEHPKFGVRVKVVGYEG